MGKFASNLPPEAPLGILGGTFNPVHQGHILTAQSVADQLHLPHVLLLPSANPPLKGQPDTPFDHRLEMVQRAIANDERLSASDLEQQLYIESGEPSYTLNTLKHLRRLLPPSIPLLWILGMDAWQQLPEWYHWQELPQWCHLVVMSRPGTNPEATPGTLEPFRQQHETTDPQALLQSPSGLLYFVPVPALDISSTALRHQLAQGKTPAGIAPAVLDYIQAHQLYGYPAGSANNNDSPEADC